jgi:hypothetical protein
MVVYGISCGENGLKIRSVGVWHSRSAAWILLGYVVIAQERRAVGPRVSLSAAPANAVAVEASIVAAGDGWHRPEERS